MMADNISLTELQLIIKDSLYMALPDQYWVVAEISELKENSAGHCYLELIEKSPEEKNVKARVKAIIWSNRYRFLTAFFQNITGEYLSEGMKVLVKTKIEYHELYGLSLIISDIDPSYTIGEMALKRQLVIKRLSDEGVILMNKEIEFPPVPQRIAVISSGSAAGYMDFIDHLKNNSHGYVYYTALFETIMQGNETEKSVISALDRIAGYIDIIDVVVIIRGGGSQTDLSWFDSYNIAYHVTQFPLPVITGIGHEKDLSVTDMVAFQSLKTPTAVADYLIDVTVNTEEELNELISDINDITRSVIDNNLNVIDSYKLKLITAAGAIPAAMKAILDRHRTDLIRSTFSSLDKVKTRISVMDSTLGILDPANVLKRGYTLTTMNGKIIKSSQQIDKDDIIDTRFSDGAVKSKVMEKRN